MQGAQHAGIVTREIWFITVRALIIPCDGKIDHGPCPNYCISVLAWNLISHGASPLSHSSTRWHGQRRRANPLSLEGGWLTWSSWDSLSDWKNISTFLGSSWAVILTISKEIVMVLSNKAYPVRGRSSFYMAINFNSTPPPLGCPHSLAALECFLAQTWTRFWSV